MSANRSRSTSAHDFLPKDGEEFFPPIIDDWAQQKKLVLFRIEQNAEKIVEGDAAVLAQVKEDAAASAKRDGELGVRIDKVDDRLQAIELKFQYQLGKIVGAAIIASFLLTLILQYFQVFTPGTP